MSACAGCGAPVDPARARYDHAGQLVCEPCGIRADIVDKAKVDAEYEAHMNRSQWVTWAAWRIGPALVVGVVVALRACAS